MSNEPIHILSLGAGVQSGTAAKMAAKGLIKPMPKAAIFADTKAEPQSVYDFLAWLKASLPFPVICVSRGNLAEDGLRVTTSRKSGKVYAKTLIPLFILSPDGKKGILKRKCTAEYKVREIIKATRRLVGAAVIAAWRKKHVQAWKLWKDWELACKAARKLKKELPLAPFEAWESMQADPLVISWIGISTDESDRAKESRIPWIKARWPLLEMGITRAQCLEWMASEGSPKPPRSACYFCPYHSDKEWLRLKREEPAAFEAAVKWEQAAQAAQKHDEVTRGIVYLHSARVPLNEVVLKEDVSDKATFGAECEGMCGV